MKKLYFLNYILLAVIVFTSCSPEEGESEIPAIEDLKITTVTGLDVLKGADTPLLVLTKNGDNVTSKSSIFVNDVKINGATYNFNEDSSYKVYAEVDTLKTSVVSINVVTPSHTTKVMIEDYTALWCPYCPRMVYKIDKLAKENENIIPVGLHNDKTRKDALTFPNIKNLRSTFGIKGYPVSNLNRIHRWRESNKQIETFLARKKNLGLAIKSSISGDELTAEIKVHYDVKSITENKLVVYLLENGLIASQANYYNNDSSSPWYQRGNPIKDFVHDFTARTTLTDELGDLIPEEAIKTNAVYKKNFTIKIPNEIKDNSKLELVAFVVDDKKEVINVQKAKVGETKDFD